MWPWFNPIAENRMRDAPAFVAFPLSLEMIGRRSNDSPDKLPGNALAASPAAVVSDCFRNLRLFDSMIVDFIY
jgi:hypothetical protein